MKKSKAYNVLLSTLTGLSNSIILLILNLISRNLFLQYIGIEYLSVAQVINDLLTVIAFSELGVTNAVLYMLYTPVATNNRDKVIKILYLYRNFNRYVGICIAIIGLLAMPTLSLFIRTDVPYSTVQLIYLMNLFTSVSSYFYTYRSIMLSVNQKDYIASIISSGCSVIRIIIQCIIIYYTHNYILFLLTSIIATVLQNIIIYYKVGKIYPYICNLSKLNKNIEFSQEKKDLKSNILSMAFVKITGIAIHNTDTIIISSINTIMVGICANYTIISNYLRSLINIFQNALVHSIGISVVERNKEKRYELFQQIYLINIFISGFIFICLANLWNDFIVLWIGDKYLLDKMIFIALLISVSWNLMVATVWMFRDTLGLFKNVKCMLLLNTIIKIILSIVLGYYFGVAGVFIATVISDIFTDFWYDSNLVFKRVFGKNNAIEYQLSVLINMLSVGALSYLLIFFMSNWNITIYNWLLKLFIVIAVYILFFILRFGKTKAFRMLYTNYIQIALNKFIKRG